jgi:hypothetical protein
MMKKITISKSIFWPVLLIIGMALVMAGCADIAPGTFDEPAQEIDPRSPDESGALTAVTPTLEVAQADTPSPAGLPEDESELSEDESELPEDQNELPEDELTGVMPRLTVIQDEFLAASLISETIPAHIRFTFDGYMVTDTIHEAHIAVYSAAEYEAMSEMAAGQIEALRRLLAERPETAAGPLPFLPVTSAEQIMTAHVAYLDFQNGTGVRYLTQYGVGIKPVNNSELFFTFQGLTDDGRYYISAVLPVTHPDLPASVAEAPEEFTADADSYLAGVVDQLNEAEATAFSPDLSLLDAVIISIRISDDDTMPLPVDEETDHPAAVLSAIQFLSEETAIPQDEMEILSVEARVWPDGCLGLAEPDEACTLALVPGWLIIIQAEGRTIEVRTDETGNNVRWRWEFTLQPES